VAFAVTKGLHADGTHCSPAAAQTRQLWSAGRSRLPRYRVDIAIEVRLALQLTEEIKNFDALPKVTRHTGGFLGLAHLDR
jgi:hypothetical protein